MSVSTTIPQVVVAVSSTDMASNYVGVYSSSVEYQVGQWVAYEEILYVCVAVTTDNAPTDTAYWRVVGAIG